MYFARRTYTQTFEMCPADEHEYHSKLRRENQGVGEREALGALCSHRYIDSQSSIIIIWKKDDRQWSEGSSEKESGENPI